MPLPKLLRAKRYAGHQVPVATLSSGYGAGHYLTRELWSTDDAAAIDSPHTSEPGPGGWTITGTDQSISGQRVTCPANVAAQGFVATASIARQAGVAIVLRNLQLDATPGGTFSVGFHTSSTLTTGIVGGGIYTNNSNNALLCLPGSGIMFSPRPTTDVDFDLAVVLRATGHFLLHKLSSASVWTLLMVNDVVTTTPVWPMIAVTNAASTLGPVSVVTGFQVPRVYYSASGTIGTVTLPISDFVAKMRVTGTATQALNFRIQDADNYWQIERAATTFRLYEVVAGSPTQRATGSITAATGDRIIVACEGSLIRLFHQVNGSTMVTPTAYASASNFATAKGIAVTDEANYTELEVFNRTQYGVAA